MARGARDHRRGRLRRVLPDVRRRAAPAQATAAPRGRGLRDAVGDPGPGLAARAREPGRHRRRENGLGQDARVHGPRVCAAVRIRVPAAVPVLRAARVGPGADARARDADRSRGAEVRRPARRPVRLLLRRRSQGPAALGAARRRARLHRDAGPPERLPRVRRARAGTTPKGRPERTRRTRPGAARRAKKGRRDGVGSAPRKTRPNSSKPRRNVAETNFRSALGLASSTFGPRGAQVGVGRHARGRLFSLRRGGPHVGHGLRAADSQDRRAARGRGGRLVSAFERRRRGFSLPPDASSPATFSEAPVSPPRARAPATSPRRRGPAGARRTARRSSSRRRGPARSARWPPSSWPSPSSSTSATRRAR